MKYYKTKILIWQIFPLLIDLSLKRLRARARYIAILKRRKWSFYTRFKFFINMSAIARDGHSGHLSTDWRRSAGDFVCAGPCGRKRLPASASARRRPAAIAGVRAEKNGEKRALCKECVARSERETAAAAAAAVSTEDVSTGEAASMLHCSACSRDLPASSFSKSQKTKISRDKPGRCLVCVEKAEEQELQQSAEKRAAATKALASKVSKGGGSSVASRLALACAETAAEAETITGLKPKLASGRRRRGVEVGAQGAVGVEGEGGRAGKANFFLLYCTE